MIYKITMSVYGDNFNPDNVIDKLKGDYQIVNIIKRGEKKRKDSDDKYEFGDIGIWHVNKFATENQILEYENFFVTFINENYSLLKANKVTDIDLYYEVFHDGGQCNFSILSAKELQIIAKYGVSFPISIYKLNKNKMKNWSNEINEKWEEKVIK
jgi:hypothetical protein